MAAPNARGDGVTPVARRLHYTFNSATRTIYRSGNLRTSTTTTDTESTPGIEQPQFAFFDAEHINFAKVTVRKVIIPWTTHNVIKDVNDRVVVGTISALTDGAHSESFTVPPGLYPNITALWHAIEVASTGSSYPLKFTDGGTTAEEVIAEALLPDPNPDAGAGHCTIEIQHPVGVYSAHIVGTAFKDTFVLSSDNLTTCYAPLGLSALGQYRISNPTAQSTKIISTYTPDPWQGMRSFNIECNLTFGHMYSTTRNRLVSVVERVPAAIGTVGDVIIYEPVNPSAFLVDSFSTFSLVKFEVRDNLNRVIDLHGLDWSIEFIVEEL